MKKVCFKCNSNKSILEFRTLGGGRYKANRCKECDKIIRRERERLHPPKRQKKIPEREKIYTASKKQRHIENPQIYMLCRIRARSKEKKLAFNLTKEYIASIWPVDNKCPIFGFEFSVKGGKVTDYSPSLDRINNNKGYVQGNVAVISFKANILKRTGSVDDFRKLLDWMIKNTRQDVKMVVTLGVPTHKPA